MKISLSEGTWDKSTADIVAIAIPSGKTPMGRALGRVEVVTGKGSIKPLASDERFEGKVSQTLKVTAGGKTKARWLLLVGIGEEKDAQKIAWNVGHALASVARAQKSAAVELPEVTPGSVRAVSHGLVAVHTATMSTRATRLRTRRSPLLSFWASRKTRVGSARRFGQQSGRRKRQLRA
jgi:leucyl aminopeptidase